MGSEGLILHPAPWVSASLGCQGASPVDPLLFSSVFKLSGPHSVPLPTDTHCSVSSCVWPSYSLPTPLDGLLGGCGWRTVNLWSVLRLNLYGLQTFPTAKDNCLPRNTLECDYTQYLLSALSHITKDSLVWPLRGKNESHYPDMNTGDTYFFM